MFQKYFINARVADLRDRLPQLQVFFRFLWEKHFAGVTIKHVLGFHWIPTGGERQQIQVLRKLTKSIPLILAICALLEKTLLA